LPGSSGVGFDFGDITSAISIVAAPVLAPVLKAAAPVLKPIEAAYKAIPTPLKAILAPQTLVTEYAYQHPEQIPMFGKFASAAKATYEKAMAMGNPPKVAATVAAAAIHPAMLHPPVAAALVTHPARKQLMLSLGLPAVPTPAALVPHLAPLFPGAPDGLHIIPPSGVVF
jgi:hypothetical protein